MFMKALFIGGTGIISSGCTPEALSSGIELTLLNRGQSSRPTPVGAEVLVADFRDQAVVDEVLARREFDVVVNWIAYTPEQVARDIAMFQGRVGQYIFISSASAYQKPLRSLPITESTPLENPYWEYSRNKAACEDVLMEAYFTDGFPVTIVRPSHTYDKTLTPLPGGKTMMNRLLKGKPVIVHGDGTSLWVLTHHKDFAVGFVGLMGNPHAVGEAFHITSDELLSWNQIAELVASAAGVEVDIVHLTSETINRYYPEWGAGLLGDKANSVIFDNSKIKRFVPAYKAKIPFHQGAREIVDWYLGDEARILSGYDPELDALIDRMIKENE
jgi:nucleoside-diphosphate-sugar epimerase